jgi:polysaccharide pyruvyl transferase WcaK-like protein
MAKDLYRVGITGSYGGLNLGDEAILQSIISQLRKDLPKLEITVFSRDAEDTKRRHQVERAVPVRKLSRAEIVPEVERLDLLILGGGGILYDADARTYLREVQLAREKRVPVFVYAIGAGPLTHAAAQAAVRENLAEVEMVTVREKSAHRVLEESGLHRDVVVTADPALLLKPEPLPRGILRQEGLEGRRRLIGMSVREPGVAAPDLDEKVYHALLANAADFMVDRWNANVVFVPMERSVLDTQHSHAVIAKMLRAQRATVLKGEYTAGRADPVLDGQVRLRARHAAALPDLRCDPGNAVRRAAVCREGERLPGSARGADPAAQPGERRPADRLPRRLLGPAPLDAHAHRRNAARAAGARARNPPPHARGAHRRKNAECPH